MGNASLAHPTLFFKIALLAPLLFACQAPPPEAYFGGHAGIAAVAIGKNATGEACTQQGDAIFCGTWEQPSAHVRQGEALSAGTSLASLATGSPWRAGIDTRYDCAPPTATTVLGNEPAYALNCTRKLGGWPQVALLAAVNGRAYYADGVLPTLPVIERAIGVLAGRNTAESVTPTSGADALFAARLAAQSYGSGTIGQYDQLMQAGARANLAENFAAAEQAYRAALALQQKALGRDNPNTVTALTALALQVSNEGRFAEADALFAQADRLAPSAADRAALPRLQHYRALNDINQGRDEAALTGLRQAEAGYMRLLPPDALIARPRAVRARVYSAGGSGFLAGQVDTDTLALDPSIRNALIGVVETRRYQAIALRHLGRLPESESALRAAELLAAGHAMRQPILTARLFRTDAADAAARGEANTAISDLDRSTADFGAALPGTRPIALTELLAAGQLTKQANTDGALAACRRAIALLRSLRTGVPGALLQPCLTTYAAQASANPADAQLLLGEMFEAAQLAQGGITSQQIALATARLAENARDPKVGAAIRRRQDSGEQLSALIRAQELATAPRTANEPRAAVDLPALDKQITEARANLADADAALQAASPNYGQLVQQVASAKEVLAALAPNEAFAAIVLGEQDGWVFVLHGGQVAAARTGLSAAATGALVTRIRAGIEPTGPDLPRFDTEAANTLYASTIGRLEPAMAGTQSLVVAPTGPLLSLPFAVLLTGPASPDSLGTAPWLLRRYTIAHVPAAANFVTLRKVAGGSRATHPWFGFGDFIPSTLAQATASFPGATCANSARLFAGLPPLAYAGRELAAARAVLGGSGSDELLGAAFTSEAVRHADLKSDRILHFATHALLPAELRCVDEPAIVTSNPPNAVNVSGALLTASQITGLDLDAEAVILSACNSGGSGSKTADAQGGGESLSGLARSFFYAGARALMVTHWSVNDQAAAFLVADTLNRLRSAESGGLAGALRGAELGLLDDAGKRSPAAFAHPFFWAPFAVIGEGRGRSNVSGPTATNTSGSNMAVHSLAGL